jgi:hypothetical protein
VTYELRYHPDTDLGRRFPHWVIATFRTREAAVAVRQQCASAASIEVVPVDEPPVDKGESAKMGVQHNGPERGVGTSGRGLIDADRSAN